MRASVIAVVWLCAACSSRAPAPPATVSDSPETAEPERPDMTDAMHPTESGEFVAGPALTPSAPLLAWLHQQGRDRLVRIPVVITFGNPGRFSIGSAYIGVEAGTPPADAIRLKLDGTTLGVSLVDRVRGKCADKKQMTCVLWIDGMWGPLMEGGGALGAGDSDDGRHPFTVRAVGDVVDPATATTAFSAAK